MEQQRTLSKTEIAQGYDEIASQIGMSAAFYEALLAFAEPVAAPVLDIGCGGGHLLDFLKQRAGFAPTELAGMDLSHRLCELARGRSAAFVARADAELLPFRNGYFGTVFMTEVLEHIQNPLKAFREVHRVLADAGVWLLTVPNRDWLRYDAYIQRKRRFQPVDDRFYKLEEITELAEQSGFTIANQSGYGSLRHGGPVWGLIEKLQMAVNPALRTKRKRLFVKLVKTAGR